MDWISTCPIQTISHGSPPFVGCTLCGRKKMYFLVHKVIRNRSIWGPCQFLIFVSLGFGLKLAPGPPIQGLPGWPRSWHENWISMWKLLEKKAETGGIEMYKGFQSEGQMGRKQMSTKWGHILCGVAFEFNCRIGKTHILCEWSRLYIYIYILIYYIYI